ncbi:unnamed protein product [Cuscuta epithymum]|nr:unnamed protein product [Cuscuta epithymum]
MLMLIVKVAIADSSDHFYVILTSTGLRGCCMKMNYLMLCNIQTMEYMILKRLKKCCIYQENKDGWIIPSHHVWKVKR